MPSNDTVLYSIRLRHRTRQSYFPPLAMCKQVYRRTPSTGEGEDGVSWYLSNWLAFYTSPRQGTSRARPEARGKTGPHARSSLLLGVATPCPAYLVFLETQAGNPT